MICKDCGTELIPVEEPGHVWKQHELRNRPQVHSFKRCFEVVKSRLADALKELQKGE